MAAELIYIPAAVHECSLCLTTLPTFAIFFFLVISNTGLEFESYLGLAVLFLISLIIGRIYFLSCKTKVPIF